MSSIGGSISTNVTAQLRERQKIFDKKAKDEKDLRFLSSKSAWILMRSSVDTIPEKASLAVFTAIANRKSSGKNTKAKNYKLSNAPNRAGVGGNNALYSTDSLYGYRPKPGITSISVQSKNTFGTLLEAVVKFKVFSIDDFNIIEKLYFRPGYSVLLEWGNSVYVDNDGKIQYASAANAIDDDVFFSPKSFNGIDELVQQKRLQFDGNYDGMFGYIVNFDWNFNNDGSYDCSVKILSRGTVLEGLKGAKMTDIIPSSEIKSDEKEDEVEEETKSLFHYIVERGTDNLNNYGGAKVKSLKEALRGNDANTVANKLRGDVDIFMMHQEDKDGAEIDIFFMPLRGLLMIYNSFIALSNPGKSADALFVTRGVNNKHSMSDVSFSIDPSICVLPYPPSSNPDKNLKECKLRPGKMKDLHTRMQSYVGGKSKNVLDIMVCSTTIKAVAEQFMVGDINENKGMMDFIQGILGQVNEALGGIPELDVAYHHEGDYKGKFTIVDRNGQKAKNPEQIDVFGLSSTVFGLNVSSKISSNIANQVAIAAQSTKSATSQEDLSVMMNWNRGAIDRHMPVKEQGEAKTADDTNSEAKKADRRKKFVEGFEEVYDNFNNKGNKNFDPAFLTKFRADATAELVSYKAKKSTSDPTLGVVPVELSMDLDGIQGFVIGSSFKINQGILPKKYNRFGFIITGVSHEIGTDMKWKTSVGTQFYPLKNADTTDQG